WTDDLDFRLGQELQHRLERISLALGGQRERRVSFVAPIEAAFGITEQDIGGFEEAQAGKHLSWVEEIDGDRCRAHRALSIAEGAGPSSLSREACWSAARMSASHHASPHGPQRL